LVERETRRRMEDSASRVSWQLTDHGMDHVIRVRETTRDLIDTLNELSVARRNLGRLLTEDEQTRLELAAVTHDIGLSLSENQHARAGADEIRDGTTLMPKAQERDEIARLVELHSKTELRRRYGTADLTELVRQGRINKELAFKAGLLRLADGLDAD